MRATVRSRSRAQLQRGFTLVELLVVVAIVGILATIGITLFRKHISSGHSIEAFNMVQSIGAAQERYRAESLRYLDVSTSLTSYYPRATPDRDTVPWDNGSHDDYARWRKLNVTNPGNVRAVYTTVAGNAGTDPSSVPFNVLTLPAFGVQNEPWYLIHAKADFDGNSVFSLYLASSLNGEVYVENDGE